MQMCVIEMMDRPGSPLYHLEAFIEGNYVKYNSNSGFVADDDIRATPQVILDKEFNSSNEKSLVQTIY